MYALRSSQPDESEIIIRKGGSHIHISKSAGFMDSKDDPIAYHDLNQKIKVLIRNIFEEYFKPLGFRQNGQNFRLYQENGLCKIVNFQKYRYNHNKNCSLTVNIGFYIEKDIVIQNRNFYESDCQIRIRPSHEYYGEERWWPVNDDRSLEQFAKEIRSYFENTALPWLNQFANREELIAEMLERNSMEKYNYHLLNYENAGLLAECGYGAQLLQLLENQENDNIPEIRELIRKIKKS